ncbi:MAG: PolB1-binding protein PBP2 family protein [Acidilobus sp.]
MSEDWRARAYNLLEVARGLKGDLKTAFVYFVEGVSVGDLRALGDLRKRGVRDPASAIEGLIELGLIERGRDCFNLSEPLRRMVYERGLEAVERALEG